IFLRPWEERNVTTADVSGTINREIGQVAAVRGNAQVRNSLNRGRGQQINFVIAGATYPDLARVRDRILAAAANNPGIVNLDSDYKENKPQLRIQVDTARARDLGLYNKLRAITLSGGLAPGYTLGEALTFLERAAAQSPEVLAVGYRGESQSFKEAGGSIYFVFLLTILIVYLLLAAQFESFVHPGVIITTVPLAVAG